MTLLLILFLTQNVLWLNIWLPRGSIIWHVTDYSLHVATHPQNRGCLRSFPVCASDLPDVAREPVVVGVLFFVGLKVSSKAGKTEEWIKWRRRRTLVCRRAEDEGQYSLRANYRFSDIILYQQLCSKSEGKKKHLECLSENPALYFRFLHSEHLFFFSMYKTLPQVHSGPECRTERMNMSQIKTLLSAQGTLKAYFFSFLFLYFTANASLAENTSLILVSVYLQSLLFPQQKPYIVFIPSLFAPYLSYIEVNQIVLNKKHGIMQLFPHLGRCCAVILHMLHDWEY